VQVPALKYERIGAASASQSVDLEDPPPGARVVIKSLKASRAAGGVGTALTVAIDRKSDSRNEHSIVRTHAAGAAASAEDNGEYVSDVDDSFNIEVLSGDSGQVNAHITYYFQTGG
jgi:hypothetical protein